METLWPQQGDKAIKSGSKACFLATKWASAYEFSLMAEGYKTASDILVQYLESGERNDALVYPVLFGYRQYLELRLKGLVLIVKRAEYLEETYQRIHDLERLWNSVRDHLRKDLEADEKLAFEVVESVIAEFQALDPKSDGFRFPSDICQFNLDLLNLRVVMGRVAYFLDSMTEWWMAGVEARE